MRRSLIVMLLSSLALATAACGGPAAQQPAEAPAEAAPAATPGGTGTEERAAPSPDEATDDPCADKQPTGDPPACPEGCVYDPVKARCKQDRGVIVDQ